MKRFVIIVAGGSGRRMKSIEPKQFIELNGKPILMHTIQTFFSFDQKLSIIVVLPEDQLSFWQKLCNSHEFSIPHQLVPGGDNRFQSVQNGISLISEEGLVAIHDGVRPLVSHETIARCFDEAEKYGNAIPCISVHETVRQIVNDTPMYVDRSSLKLMQTPQVFSCNLIRKALEQTYLPSFTDEASVLEHIGIPIHLVEGNRENIKITEPFDLAMAEWLINYK